MATRIFTRNYSVVNYETNEILGYYGTREEAELFV